MHPPRRGYAPLAFPTVNRDRMARLYGRAGRLTAKNGEFWPGQYESRSPPREVRRPPARARYPPGATHALSLACGHWPRVRSHCRFRNRAT